MDPGLIVIPPSKLYLNEESDVGMVQSTTQWSGFRSRSLGKNDGPTNSSGRLRGLAWSESEYVVCTLPFEPWEKLGLPVHFRHLNTGAPAFAPCIWFH